MVCVYCGSETSVSNSRAKARTPSVWRRRNCSNCGAQFTTIELPDYPSALSVQYTADKDLSPFSRDKLYLSMHRSLGHRPDSLSSATTLVTTIIGQLLSQNLVKSGVLSSQDIAKVSYQTLKRFDPLAANNYRAYHQATLKKGF